MINNIRYKTSSPAGDLISYMAGFRQIYKDTGRKAVIYQRLNMPGVSYADSVHPFQNDNGEPVCMNMYMFNMLSPLVLSQEYVDDFIIYDGQDIDWDMDLIRQERFTNQPRGSLGRWFNYVYPEMTSNLSDKWVNVHTDKENKYSKKVIINFTERHRNHIISYFFLKEHQDKIIFAGIKKERDLFCEQWGLDIPLLQVNDFLELSKIIDSSLFFMGNQSFCFQVAEAMKVPRILELFPLMPNVIPIGDNAYDFYNQGAVEFYFNKLLNK